MIPVPRADGLPAWFEELPAVARTVWLTRTDLHDAYREQRTGFLAWCLIEGRAEYRSFDPAGPDFDPELTAREWNGCLEGVDPPITELMHGVWTRRPDLQAAFDLRVPEEAQEFVDWCFVEGVRELDLAPLLTRAQVDAMTRPLRGTAAGLTRVMALTHARRPDLRATFDLQTGAGRHGLANWFRTEGVRETRDDRLAGGAGPPGAAARPVRRRRLLSDSGVNLVGHARADMGIGEDVRAAARALAAVGVPYAIVDVGAGARITAGERVDEAMVAATAVFDTTLFCTTGMEMARVVAAEGASLLDGQRVIGCWPWELPAWPAPWRHAFDLVDEVWAASRHAEAAYRGATGKPVRRMAMAVTLPAPAPLSRPDFGLPDGVFLFLFAFDALSYLARKNPLAVVAAFHRAFPDGDEPVGLVLKVMRAGADPASWARVQEAIAPDPRIHVVDRTCGRHELVALYQACDALVSLHRAEGFGRVLAEMMLLGKPVIATAWSGTADFLTVGTGCPVPYRLVPVGAGEYPYGEGMAWADPDIEAAAEWMHRLSGDRTLAARIGAAGKAVILRRYAPEVVGRQYLERLAMAASPASGEFVG